MSSNRELGAIPSSHEVIISCLVVVIPEEDRDDGSQAKCGPTKRSK